MIPNPERLDKVAHAFQRHFASAPSLWCRAPGRVDLMGGHTDYNLGFVLTMAIDRDTWIAARPRPDRTVCLHAMNLDDSASFSLDSPVADPRQRWTHYLQGVVRELEAEGLPLCGFDGVIQSTVRISSGLSSSAALECATTTLFEALGGWMLT